jgi:hypothetical protein
VARLRTLTPQRRRRDRSTSTPLANATHLEREPVGNSALPRDGQHKARETKKQGLLAKLARLADAQRASEADRPTIEAKLKEQAKDWNGAFAISPAAGRQILRRVLSSPIYVAKAESGGWRYRFTGHLGNLIRGGFESWLLPEDEDLVFQDVDGEPGDIADEQADVNGGCEPSGSRTPLNIVVRGAAFAFRGILHAA